MSSFTILWMPLIGGMLLGVSAIILLFFNGKIAGISGIFSGIISPKRNDTSWRVVFIMAMIAGGLMASTILGIPLAEEFPFSPIRVVVGGLLVGIGTKLGNGCTSGHGICGIGRLSKRSMVATVVFMATAIMTVFIRYHLLN